MENREECGVVAHEKLTEQRFFRSYWYVIRELLSEIYEYIDQKICRIFNLVHQTIRVAVGQSHFKESRTGFAYLKDKRTILVLNQSFKSPRAKLSFKIPEMTRKKFWKRVSKRLNCGWSRLRRNRLGFREYTSPQNHRPANRNNPKSSFGRKILILHQYIVSSGLQISTDILFFLKTAKIIKSCF